MATTQENLDEAKAALHALMVGKKAVEVQKSDGSKVKFDLTNVNQLRAYIVDLEAQLGILTRGRRRAIGVKFS